MLRIYLLGSFRLLYQERPLNFIALPRTLPLWAYLLLSSQPSTRDGLAGRFWPDVGGAEARANLRRHLHDLRRALPDPDPNQPWLLTEHDSVQWNPTAAWLDVTQFEQAASDPSRLAAAVELYTGDLLPQLYEDWIFSHRERLRLRFFDCLLGLMQGAYDRQDFVQAIRYAQQILHHDPIREDVVRRLMTLRQASGDRAGALQEYQHFAQRLRDELAVTPMLETSALYDAIAQQTMAVVARGNRHTPAPSALPSVPSPVAPSAKSVGAPHNLPAQLTTFIGREREVAAVQQLLFGPGERVRLLTLTGPGGSGKTRLALEVGARLAQRGDAAYPDGVFVVWLATVHDPALLLPTVANTLRVSESVGKSLLETLQDYLRHRHMVLILDNLEQLTAAARQLTTLLTAAPDLQMIVTSRALLQVYGEQEFAVQALSLPAGPALVPLEEATHYAALALFVARSRAVNPTFVLNAQNLAAVTAICLRLDGLPLAIELAAARSKLYSPQAILARLDNALTFLGERGGGRPAARGLADRHQTLRATLDWSYNLLAAADQRLFVRLGVFVGGFSLEQAATVCDVEETGETLDGLETLINNSLLRQYEVDGEIYFRFLATVHEYAAVQLAASSELDRLQRRHALAFLAYAQEVAPKLHGPQQAHWLRQLELAHANLRAALTWASQGNQATIALPLATALHYFWGKGGHLTEGRRWLAEVLALDAAQTPSPLRAAALSAAAWLETAYTDVDHTLPRAYYAESIALSQQLDSPATLAAAQVGLATTLYATDLVGAQELAAAGLALFRQLGDHRGEANALVTLARVLTQRGDYAQGRLLLDQGVNLLRALGDPWSIGHALLVQGVLLHFDLHQHAAARDLYHQAWAMAQTADDKTVVAMAQVNLADLAIVDGDYTAAEALASQALPTLQGLGELWQPPRLLRILGLVAATGGDHDRAIGLISESIALNRRLNDQRAVIAGLVALAHLASCQGDLAATVRRLAVVEQAIAHYQAQLLPADLAVWARSRQVAQTHLAPDEYQAAWAEGEQLSMDQAIAQAVGDAGVNL